MYQWLRIDEEHQINVALNIVKNQIDLVEKDLHSWEWVIIALHNALQGSMVLALRGSNGLNVLNDECATKWMEAYEMDKQPPSDIKLDSFMNLYKKIKSKSMLLYGISKKFDPKGTQGKSIKQLNKFRNEFIHFVPKSWSIEVSGFPQMVIDCLEIMYFLLFESCNVLWSDDNNSIEIKALIQGSRNIAMNLKDIYISI